MSATSPGIHSLAASESERQSIPARIIEAIGEYEAFTTRSGDAAICVTIDDRKETLLTESPDITKLLRFQYKRGFNKFASEKHIKEAIGMLAAEAQFSGVQKDIYLRTAMYKDKLYIDLCNTTRQVIEISANKIGIITNPPVHFLRLSGMKALPVPDCKGDLAELRSIIQLPDDTWQLFVGTVLACYHPSGPYPITVISGEHRSGKTTLTTIFRHLVDPVESPLRSLPTKLDDYWIMVRNEHILVFDNVSTITDKVSDTLCCISTGGGSSTRQFYNNYTQVTLAGRRPIILNGIAPVLTREDLIDRTITIELPTIPDGKYATELNVMEKFNRIYPRLFGAICKGLQASMKPPAKSITLPNLRMSDIAEFVTRCEPALGWERGTFIRAYGRNSSESRLKCLEDNALYNAMRILLVDASDWRGTANELIAKLRDDYKIPYHIRKIIPFTPNRLSAELRRIQPFLNGTGISLSFTKANNRNRDRIIVLCRIGECGASIKPKPLPLKQHKLKLLKTHSPSLPLRIKTHN